MITENTQILEYVQKTTTNTRKHKKYKNTTKYLRTLKNIKNVQKSYQNIHTLKNAILPQGTPNLFFFKKKTVQNTHRILNYTQ